MAAAPSLFTLGKDTATGKTVSISQDVRERSMYLIGKAGSGKTHFMQQMALQDIQNGQGVCIIDPHGGLIETVLACLPQNRIQDVVILDPLDQVYSFCINLCEVDAHNSVAMQQAVDYIGQIWGKLFSKEGDLSLDAPNMARTLRHAMYALIDAYATYQTTLAEIPLLIDSSEARKKIIATVQEKNSLTKRFWTEYDAMKKAEQFSMAGSTLSRLEPFIQNDYIRHVIGGGKSTINFRTLMDGQKIVLVPLPREHERLSKLIGSIIISQIIQAAFSRVSQPEALRKPFYLYIDELSLFSSPALASLISTIFAEARKFKLILTAANQWLGQFKDEETRQAVFNAGSLVAFRVSGEDSEVLAKEFSVNRAAPASQAPLSSAILSTLQRDGHPNPSIMNGWVYKYSRTLFEAAREEVDELRGRQYDVGTSLYPVVVRVTSKNLPPGSALLFRYDPQVVKTGLQQLNDWICTRLPDTARDAFLRDIVPSDILSHFAHVLHFSNYLTALRQQPTPHLKQAVQKRQQARGDSKREKEAETAFFAACLDYFDKLLSYREKDVQTSIHGFVYDGVRPASSMDICIEMYANEQRAYVEFTETVKLLISCLRKEPLTLDARKYGGALDPSRTFSDLRNELAQRLTDPADYCAYAKIGTSQYTSLQALPLPPAIDRKYDIREAIRIRNKLLYLKSRTDIEREIQERQRRLAPPEPPSFEPPPAPVAPIRPPRSPSQPSGAAPFSRQDYASMMSVAPSWGTPQTSGSPVAQPPDPFPFASAQDRVFIERFTRRTGFPPPFLASETPEERFNRRNGITSTISPPAPSPSAAQAQPTKQQASRRQQAPSAKQKKTKQEDDEK